MPDYTIYTMCRDSQCPRCLTCWRFMARPHFMQSYFAESPRDDEDDCKYYWKMEE